MLGPTLITMITSDATLAPLVSTRVYALQFPADPTFPCITYREISGYQVPNTGAAVYISRVQIDIWDRTYNGVGAVADGVKALFNLAESGDIVYTSVDLMFDIFEQGTKLYRKVIDVSIKHEDN